jgi:predicted PurR-regulated permease PerM
MVDVRDPGQLRASSEWGLLRARLRTVTPRTVARVGLVTAVAGAAVAVVIGTWPVLAPFVGGGLIAYLLMPVVDGLDRVIPRGLAAFLAMAALIAALIGAMVVVLPPLTAGFLQLALELPTDGEVSTAAQRLEARFGELPEGAREVVVPVVAAVASAVRGIFSGVSGGLDEVVRGVVESLLRAVSAILGLIVLPAWVLAVMTEKQRARRAIDERIAPWLRKDAWAVVTMADRAAGAYLRGYVVAGAFVGALVYLGAILAPRLGAPAFAQPLPLAVYAGVTQVIPVVGPLLGFLPGVLLAVVDPERAAAYVVIYVGAQIIGGRLVRARLMERRLGVHPLLLVPAVLVVGQLGLVWLLLSAPIASFVADAIRYAHGRLSEPPRPAGVLPRTAAWAGAQQATRRRARWGAVPGPPPLAAPVATPTANAPQA